jgi:type VII secretion-associated serine protease mycosin
MVPLADGPASDARPTAVRAIAVFVLCAVGAVSLLAAALLALTPGAASPFDRAKAAWYTAPVDQLLPATVEVDFSNLQNASQTLVRIGVSRPSPCRGALDPRLAAQLAAQLGASRCRAVLRATYTNQVQSLVATAGVVALDDTQAQAPSMPAHPAGGVRAAAFPGTAAAGFSDRRRVVTQVSFPTGMPYGFGASVAMASGAVDSSDLQTQAIQSGAQNVSDGLISALLQAMNRVAFGQATPQLAVTMAARTDAVRGQEWWLDRLQLGQAWALSRGQGVTVAVLDTGVDQSHPDLAGSVTAGPDLYPDGAALGDPDWGQHGTAMASLIAGHGHGAGQALGMLGVAPAARILSLRVIPDENDRRLRPPGSGDTLARAIRYAADHGAQVISMSLGDADYGAAGGRRGEQDAIGYAVGKGVVVVASAGNSGTTTNVTKYPAAYPGVIAVAAVDREGAHASFSERAWYLSLAAPGVDVPGALPQSQYVIGSGTSPAGAFVAGLAADVLARQPKLSPSQVREVLEQTATSSRAWNREDGWGMVQPLAAVRQAALVRPQPATPRPAAPPWKRFRGPASASPAAGPRSWAALGLVAVAALSFGGAVFLALWWPARTRRPATAGWRLRGDT